MSISHIAQRFTGFASNFGSRLLSQSENTLQENLNSCSSEAYDEIKNIENCFNSFLELFSSLICARCYGKSIHHIGLINNFIQSERSLSGDLLDKYFDDIEHGFFHGLMTCFILYLLDKERENLPNYSNEYPPDDWEGNESYLAKESLEKLFASALLHDFLKSTDLALDAVHDQELIHYFPHLADETFYHANPHQNNWSKALIIADRIELQRFPDYEEWVDERFSESFKFCNSETLKTIDYFYNTIRPTLEYFYRNRNEIFIRHGLENVAMKKWRKDYVYPSPSSFQYSYIPKGIQTNSTYDRHEIYPIESDHLPFCQNPDKIHQRQNAFCSHHAYLSRQGEFASWGQIKGFMSLKDFRKHNGKIVFSESRDHLHAASEIHVQKWRFLYQHVEKPPALPEFSNDRNENDKVAAHHLVTNRTSEIVEMSNNQLQVISQESLFRFHNLVKLLRDRITLLNQ